MSEASNVLNEKPERPVTWTTVNAGEAAFPGVPTPLSWTWSWWPTECGIRGAFTSIGAFPASFAEAPRALADRLLTIHYGNVAINLDLFRAVADAIPNSSGDDVERAYFGSVRPGVSGRPRRSRYPVVAARMPGAAVRSRLRVRRLAGPMDRWWREAVARPHLDVASARALLIESQRRYTEISPSHVVVGMVTQGLYDKVRDLCAAAGMPDAAGALVPGGQDEARWLTELWDVARGVATMDRFLVRHGYHGPLEGELSSPTWRIDPGPLQKLLGAYRRDTGRESPAVLFARRADELRDNQARLLAALPPHRRGAARALLGAARAYMPLRESGRATFLRAYDVARHAARAIGRHLAERDRIDVPEDVFYLTLAELTGPRQPPDARALVAARRELRERYRGVGLHGRPPRCPPPTSCWAST